MPHGDPIARVHHKPDTRHHQRLAVATKRVLQHASELGVTVRHVDLAAFPHVAQRGDDVAKRQQALVNVNAFLEALARSLRLLGTL